MALRRHPVAAAVCTMLLLAAAPASPQDTNRLSRETLTYGVEWRLITAGTAKLTFTPMPQSALAQSEVKLHLESAGLVSRLFRVSDDYTTLMASNFCAQSTFISAEEGSRNRETRVTYDAAARKARYQEKDRLRNSVVTHEVEIPPCVHDVIGGLMVLRTLKLEPGRTAQIPITDGKKFVQAKVEAQRREEIKTPLGTMKTVRYEVFLFDNVLYKRSGHLHIWLTDDDRHLPVQLQARLTITIGTITFQLQKVETP